MRRMGSDLLKGCSRGQLSILHLFPGLLEGMCCSFPVQVVLAIVPCTRKGSLCRGCSTGAALPKVRHCSIVTYSLLKCSPDSVLQNIGQHHYTRALDEPRQLLAKGIVFVCVPLAPPNEAITLARNLRARLLSASSMNAYANAVLSDAVRSCQAVLLAPSSPAKALHCCTWLQQMPSRRGEYDSSL